MISGADTLSRSEQEALNAQKTSGERKSINFRVHALASSLFKGAQQFYGTRFGVGIPEMRILSNLGSEGPLTATHLVTLTAMDKGLLSRILNTLHARGLVQASAPASDPRRRTWTLSRSGKQMVEVLRPIWIQREAVIQAGLSEAERELLADLLQRMFQASEDLRQLEAKALREERARKTRQPRARVKVPEPQDELVK
jgi:DNA-binding MarR family transcriptional regulator